MHMDIKKRVLEINDYDDGHNSYFFFLNFESIELNVFMSLHMNPIHPS